MEGENVTTETDDLAKSIGVRIHDEFNLRHALETVTDIVPDAGEHAEVGLELVVNSGLYQFFINISTNHLLNQATLEQLLRYAKKAVLALQIPGDKCESSETIFLTGLTKKIV